MNKLSEYQIQLVDQTIDELLDDKNFLQEDQAKKLERGELALKLRDFRDGPKDHLHSPAQVKQTPESAAEIGLKLQDDLAVLRGKQPAPAACDERCNHD